MFYFTKYTFGAVANFVTFVSETEGVSGAGVSQLWCTVDEKHSIADIVFLTNLSKEATRDDVFLVVSGVLWGYLFVPESTAAYSKSCSAVGWITVSSTTT